MNKMEYIIKLLRRTADLGPQIQGKFFASILTIFVIWLLRWIILKIVSKRIADSISLYRWRKTTGFVMLAVGIIMVGRVWFVGVQSVTTFLGLLAAGLTVALKDPIINFVGWSFILGRRLFKVGDRIQIGDSSGDVIDINLFYFTILEIGNWVHADQSTGRMIQVPNGNIFNKKLANYTKGFKFIWNEIPVTVTFESNWEKAKTILQNIINKHAGQVGKKAGKEIKQASKEFLILYSYLTPAVYVSVVDFGVSLTMRYLCHPKLRRNTTQTIWEDVLKEFAQCSDIDFAYPTQRFYNNVTEGKNNAASNRKTVKDGINSNE